MPLEEQNDILKYIQNEKDISRYKISTLEKRSSISPAKKRILSIEKEFVNLPLEAIDFEDIADVAAAISIYRMSRTQFYQTYKIEKPELYQINKAKLAKSLNERLIFIRKTGRTCMRTRVQELNPMQHSDFYYDLAKRQSIKNRTSIDTEKRQLDSLPLSELLKLEPLTLAKKRARTQAAMFSIGKYLVDNVRNLIIDESESVESLKEVSEYLDEVVFNIEENIFSNYNEALLILPKLLAGTMGENPYISKIHPLQNILNFDNLKDYGVEPYPLGNPAGFDLTKPMLGNLLFGFKKVIGTSFTRDSERNVQNKVFGILFPIPRKGNEKMTLLYKKIILDGLDISALFTNSISNIKAVESGRSNRYYKATLMHPLWRIIEMASTDNNSRYALSKIAGFKKSKFKDIDFDDNLVIKRLNENHKGFLEINDNSEILTAKTRSEEEGIADIFSLINSSIIEIKEDYSIIRSTTNEIF